MTSIDWSPLLPLPIVITISVIAAAAAILALVVKYLPVVGLRFVEQ